MQDYKVSPYTRWLSDRTPWHWGAFGYPEMAVFAPVGILANGETHSRHADEFHDEIMTAENACEE